MGEFNEFSTLSQRMAWNGLTADRGIASSGRTPSSQWQLLPGCNARGTVGLLIL